MNMTLPPESLMFLCFPEAVHSVISKFSFQCLEHISNNYSFMYTFACNVQPLELILKCIFVNL